MTEEENKRAAALVRLHELEDTALACRQREESASDNLKEARKASQKAQKAYLAYLKWCQERGYTE